MGKSKAHGSVEGNDLELGAMGEGTVVQTSLARGHRPVDSHLRVREMGLRVNMRKVGRFS